MKRNDLRKMIREEIMYINEGRGSQTRILKPKEIIKLLRQGKGVVGVDDADEYWYIKELRQVKQSCKSVLWATKYDKAGWISHWAASHKNISDLQEDYEGWLDEFGLTIGMSYLLHCESKGESAVFSLDVDGTWGTIKVWDSYN
jgi:hypothetical protein